MTTDGANRVRPDFIPAEDYACREFAALEKERLWPRVWQVACRQEQVPEVGDQLVYEICEDSILIVRSAPDEIRAFYNACSHRGRMLATGQRRTREMVCPFHGWRFNLQGKCTHIPYFENWEGKMSLDEVGLTPVRCERWGGFVFINLDPDCEPLADFLGEVIEKIGPYEFETHSFRWGAAVETDSNWKLALEAFNEAYHVQTTHAQLLQTFDDRSQGIAAGPHGYLKRDSNSHGIGTPSLLLKKPRPKDTRPVILEYMREMTHDVRSIFSERDLAAATRILTELPEDATPIEVLTATLKFRREAALAAGVGWPEMTPQQMSENGSVWHIFPNLIVLVGPTASLWYRARPIGKGDDPGRCLFEFWALERYPPGYAPKPQIDYYSDYRDFKDLPPFLAQDYENIPYLQKGVRSRGFKGARPNPRAEAVLTNFHRAVREMVGREGANQP
jgi:phenylpropionate dioxygenase-like ring-hydroxylating dioxygenase large terminal subunit